MPKRKTVEYVVCLRCGQRVRSDRFERHALNHWLMSTTLKGFKEFYREIRGETIKVQAGEA